MISNIILVPWMNIFINTPLHDDIKGEIKPKASLPSVNYEWWNNSWDFRIPLSITANGSQQNAPIELYINFTSFFKDLNIQNSLLNISTIRVIEYLSSNDFYEVECQFDPYRRSYDNKTNAVGDLIWILNGTTINGQTREFFIYFHNDTNSNILEPNYDTIRIWHEGFEEYQSGDILRPTDGQDNSHPTYWEISNTTSARGRSSLRIWGNCWKASSTGNINIDANTVVTAKMRFDDPTIVREVSGIGFHTIYTAIPAPQNSYEIRGNQNWGTAGAQKYRNQYYAPNTFFWYTFNVDTEISLNPFSYIFYIADDDSWNNLNLYWDDISIWAKPVQTTPNNTLQTVLGGVQPIFFTLQVSCKDEEGNGVSNAHIFLSNDAEPSLNKNALTDVDGKWIFTDIMFNEVYNITVNYTQNGVVNPQTETVYYQTNYIITSLDNYVEAYLSLTAIEFALRDKDNDPIKSGYVILKDGISNVGKAVLDNYGEAMIRWINNTAYNYEAYFDYTTLNDFSSYTYDQIKIADGVVNIGIHDINIATELAKVYFNVTDNTAERTPFTNAKLRIYNETDYNQISKIIANLTVGANGIVQFYCYSNETTGDWGNYTIETYFAGELRSFYANSEPISSNYNFTLNSQYTIDIRIQLDMNNYNTSISYLDMSTDIYWGDDIFFQFNFTKRDIDNPQPSLVSPNEITVQILDDEQGPYSLTISIKSFEVSTGVFNFTFNTQDFDLIGGTRYWIKLMGNYENYLLPEPLIRRFEIQAIPTGLDLYDYDLNPLTDKIISEYYSESINVSLRYYNYQNDDSLLGATITFEWNYGSGSALPDPLHSNQYYFQINTGNSPSVGKYRINLVAQLENYSTYYDIMDIDILQRPTLINGTSNLLQLSRQIYILEAQNFTLEYRDSLSGLIISDLDLTSYTWYKLDSEGNPLSGTGNEGIGTLTKNGANLYVLDFDTETRNTGHYTIFVSLRKNNYELRNAFIAIEIVKRPISANLVATGLSQQTINVIKGTPIVMTLDLTDPTNSNSPLIGATVILRVDNNNYTFTETSTPGEYVLTYATTHIDAFFSPQTLSNVQIVIEKENYAVNPISLVVIIGMEEIFPGFPSFYFYLMLVGIAIVVVTIISYRTVQQRKIPKFIKKTRHMSKLIKSRKEIPDSLLYPSKNQNVAKILGDRWELLGLSLDDTLGIESKRRRKLPEFKEDQGGAA
jgi:hypothetical protein